MENKKGPSQACGTCPNNLENVRGTITKAGDAVLYLGVTTMSVGLVALGRHASRHAKVDLTAKEVTEQYPALSEAVQHCQGPEYKQIGERRKLLGFIPISPEEQAICPAIRQEIGDPTDADAVIHYFSNSLELNREEA